MKDTTAKNVQASADNNLKSTGSTLVDTNLRGENIALEETTAQGVQAFAKENLQASGSTLTDTLLKGKDIDMKDTTGRGLQAIAENDLKSSGGSLEDTTLKGKNIDLENTTAQRLQAIADEDLRSVGSTIKDNSLLKGKNVDMKSTTTEKVLVTAEQDLKATGSTFTDTSLRGKNIDLKDTKSQRVDAIAEEKLRSTGGSAQNSTFEGKAEVNVKGTNLTNATLKSAGNVSAKDAVVHGTLNVDAGKIADVGDLSGSGAISVKGETVETSGKVEANNLSLKGDNIKLTNKEHDLGTFAIDTKKLDDIYDIINGEGMYRAMKVKDGLDLAVSDQSIVLTNNIIGEAALSLRARDIKVGAGVVISRDKGVDLEATEGDVTLSEPARY